MAEKTLGMNFTGEDLKTLKLLQKIITKERGKITAKAVVRESMQKLLKEFSA